MIEIKDLLARWSHLLTGKEAQKETLRKILMDVLSIEISPEKIQIKNNTIYLDIKPIYKNQILIKKEEIFNKLKEFVGERAPDDIR